MLTVHCYCICCREERSDPDYNVNKDEDSDDETEEEEQSRREEEPSIQRERTFLVYESCLKKLLRYCMKCGALIDPSLTEEIQNTGSQLSFHLQCFKGTCSRTYSSQRKFQK